MKTKISMVIITLILGGIAGYITQQWNERALPILQITSVSFDKVEADNLNISISDELREMSKKSSWFDTLDEENYSYKKLIDLIENDLSRTVTALGKMTSDLPKMRKYVKKYQDDLSVEQARQYRNYLKKNIDTLSLTYLTMNIAGLIKRQEVELDITKGVNIGNSFLPNGKKSLEELKSSLESRSDESSVIALQIITDWHPNDLIKALDIIIERIGEQAILNRQLKDKLSELIKNNLENIENDYLLITVSISNNGSKTISFQKYATSSLSGLNDPIFLEAKNIKGGITLAQGSTQEVELKSRNSLSPDLSKKLRTMYNTDFIKCKIAMRLVAKSKFSEEWVYSQVTNLSNFNKKLELEYREHAPKIEYN